MINQDWTRWISASIHKHFYDRRQDIRLFSEDEERNTQKEKDLFELRIDGPFYEEESAGCYNITVEINVLVQSVIDRTDFQKIKRLCGIVVAAFTSTIPVYKYGDQSDDDDTLLGCLNLATNRRERVEIHNFGRVSPEKAIQQSTVEGHYRMSLKET